MNIDWVIPCRYVEVHDNLATIAGGGIDTFWIPELPGELQVMFALRLLATTEELSEGEHIVRNRIRDPRGEQLAEMTLTLAIEAQSARPEWLAGMSLPIAIKFAVQEEGTYTVEFEVDNAEKALPLHVVHGTPG